MIRTVLWGAGQFGKEAFKYLSNLSDYDIIAICDSNWKNKESFCNEMTVVHPDDVVPLGDYDALILCADKWEPMFLKAKEYGVCDETIYCWKNKIVKKEDTYSVSVHSQDGEELYLRERFASKKEGIYVDVGAHHPIRFSNTLWAHKLGWKGVNIEPDFDSYKLFESMRPDDININAGISDKKGELEFYRFDESCFNTFDKKRADYISNSCGYKILDVVTVPTVPLQMILDQNNISHIDFLDIDVEEHEIEVLRGIQFDVVDVDIILVEQLGSNLERIVNSDIADHLSRYGYTAVCKFDRTVIYEREAWVK